MPDILQVRVGQGGRDLAVGSAIRITDHLTHATAEIETLEEYDDHVPVIAADYDPGGDEDPPTIGQHYVLLMPRAEYNEHFGNRKLH